MYMPYNRRSEVISNSRIIRSSVRRGGTNMEKDLHLSKEEHHNSNERKIPRRKLLASLAMAGGAVAAGSVLSNPVYGQSVTETVYRNESISANIISNKVFNVKDFRTANDLDDDSISIRKAIAACKSAGGGVVYFPVGTYNLISSDENDQFSHLYFFNLHNVILRGEGNGTILKAISHDKDVIRVSGGSSNIFLENLTIDRVQSNSNEGNGIHFYNWYANPGWSAYNLRIKNQYDGVVASSARPQMSFWQSCRFEENINCGVNLIMNNDEFFDTCTFVNNGKHGINVGGSSALPSDGAVYLDNCLFYINKGNGINFVGTPQQVNINLFVNGGIIDNNAKNGIYIENSQNVQISTSVTWNNEKGIYIGTGAREIRLAGVKVSDSAEEGIYIASNAKHVVGNGLDILSNGRSSQKDYFGIAITDSASYINFTGGLSGNGDDVTNISRNTQYGGILLKSGNGSPNYISILGFHYPNTIKQTLIEGSIGANIILADVGGPAFGLNSGTYLGFAGSNGAQRVRHNPRSGNIEFEWNTGTHQGTWNGSHLFLGNYHLWVDSQGRLRIKNGVPNTDTDGTVVGTQS